MTTMTQAEHVLQLLRERGEVGLTPLEALEEARTFRLAAVIWVLRQSIPDDQVIVTESETNPNGKQYARYVLRRRANPTTGWIEDTLW